ncbi:hypothetical protein BB776_00930 [Planococcus salinarum]|uniref:DUF997 domain-containing protein n=1 Tax=Planococcus salinarum TaxID=622695 RepID=A0ABX3CVI7_9BACL|nr:hypothetical protein [Planococcus salinarum]OHX49336.1 hypothetical protein BB776_00930 [Planococcus salinarum]TAA73273.1 hypothetical protein D2909_00030 [Planococcus salinarum]
MKAYKKEVQFTIWMTLAFIVVGNVGFIFSIFPTDAMLFGFPVMYIVPILMGWFGVFFLTLIAGKIGNKIDDEIDLENDSLGETDEVGRVE